MASYPHEDFATVGELHDALLAWTARLQAARGKGTVPSDLSADLDDVLATVSSSAGLLADDDRAPTQEEKDLYRSSAAMYSAFVDLVNIHAASAAEGAYASANDAAILDLQAQIDPDNQGPLGKLGKFFDDMARAVGQAAGITLVLALAIGAVVLYLMFRRRVAA